VILLQKAECKKMKLETVKCQMYNNKQYFVLYVMVVFLKKFMYRKECMIMRCIVIGNCSFPTLLSMLVATLKNCE